MTERKEGQIVAEHNGQRFRFNELVHVWEGTTPGLRPKKTEFIKAWFKGRRCKGQVYLQAGRRA